VDGVTWNAYGADLESHLQDLHRRVHTDAYRAQPVKRRFIPKPDGRQRPLGIVLLEGKIVQRAVVSVLEAICEKDFFGSCTGSGPGVGQHDALEALCFAIERTHVNGILAADIRSFFNRVDQQWLPRFLGHRVGEESPAARGP